MLPGRRKKNKTKNNDRNISSLKQQIKDFTKKKKKISLQVCFIYQGSSKLILQKLQNWGTAFRVSLTPYWPRQ